MAESNSGGWVGQVIAAIAIALVAGGSSPWWWSELKRSWQPDAPATSSAPAGATTNSSATAAVASPAPAGSQAASPPVPDTTSETRRQPAAVRTAERSAPPAASEPKAGEPDTPNPEAYRAVQRIYEGTKGVSDCAVLADHIKSLQRYARGQRLVPEQFTRTIAYPKPMAQPTIADLTLDRISRVKLAAPNCFR